MTVYSIPGISDEGERLLWEAGAPAREQERRKQRPLPADPGVSYIDAVAKRLAHSVPALSNADGEDSIERELLSAARAGSINGWTAKGVRVPPSANMSVDALVDHHEADVWWKAWTAINLRSHVRRSSVTLDDVVGVTRMDPPLLDPPPGLAYWRHVMYAHIARLDFRHPPQATAKQAIAYLKSLGDGRLLNESSLDKLLWRNDLGKLTPVGWKTVSNALGNARAWLATINLDSVRT